MKDTMLKCLMTLVAMVIMIMGFMYLGQKATQSAQNSQSVMQKHYQDLETLLKDGE